MGEIKLTPATIGDGVILQIGSETAHVTAAQVPEMVQAMCVQAGRTVGAMVATAKTKQDTVAFTGFLEALSLLGMLAGIIAAKMPNESAEPKGPTLVRPH